MNRQEARELLPWFVAGALSRDEMQAVQAFIDSGEIPREQIDAMAFVAEAAGESGAEEPRYDPQILQRVLEGLDDVEQLEPLADDPVVVVRERTPGRLSTWLSSVLERVQWSVTPPVARAAIGAQFALLLALTVSLTLREDAGEPGYEVVSGTVTGDYTVTFAPGTTESEIRSLLLENRASIVAGPSAIGLYTIDVDADADAAGVAGRLEASDLVTFIQKTPQP